MQRVVRGVAFEEPAPRNGVSAGPCVNGAAVIPNVPEELADRTAKGKILKGTVFEEPPIPSTISPAGASAKTASVSGTKLKGRTATDKRSGGNDVNGTKVQKSHVKGGHVKESHVKAVASEVSAKPAEAPMQPPRPAVGGGPTALVRSKRAAYKAFHKASDSCMQGLKKCKRLTMTFVRNPLVAIEWGKDLYEATAHFIKWIATGCSLFKSNISTSVHLVKRVAHGYPLTVRQRKLLVRTSADCMKIVPFSFFIIVPFAELLLPIVLRFFPRMMPSTFHEKSLDKPTLARKLKAKRELAVFWQQVVAQRTQAILEADDHEHADKAAELQAFEDKLLEGAEFPSMEEIMRFSRLFEQEMRLRDMCDAQLTAMSRILGLSTGGLPIHLRIRLRHHISHLRREDRDYYWEGVDTLKRAELIEACKKRAICFSGVTEEEMRSDLSRWLELSANKNIPLSLMLWIQSFYLSSRERVVSGQCAHDLNTFETAIGNKPAKAGPPEPEAEFHDLAERCKSRLEMAQKRMGNLSKEIDEVFQQPEREPARVDQVSDSDDELRLAEQRVRELTKVLALHRQIIDRQQQLIDHHHDFMVHMRDNVPRRQQDAGKMLLDQKVWLFDMMHSYSRATDDIEQLIERANLGGEVEQTESPPQVP